MRYVSSRKCQRHCIFQKEPSVAIEGVDGECEIVQVEDTTCSESDKPAQDVTVSETDEKQLPEADSDGCWRGEGITEQDIEMFEMLDIRDRNEPKVSQTATPNNTPLGK